MWHYVKSYEYLWHYVGHYVNIMPALCITSKNTILRGFLMSSCLTVDMMPALC